MNLSVRSAFLCVIFASVLSAGETGQPLPEEGSKELLQELKACKHRIAFETFRDGNWEIYVMNADGSNPVNLTNTPNVNEFYPKASPDGSKICFCADEGAADAKSRNLIYDEHRRIRPHEDLRQRAGAVLERRRDAGRLSER